MKSALFLPGLLAVLLLLGCGGRSDFDFDAATATPAGTHTAHPKTPTAHATATAARTPAAIPPKPADPSGYASAVSAYLNEAGDSVAEGDCLKSLFQDWGMPWDAESPPSIVGNTDADAESEVAVMLSDISADRSRWQIVVFDSPEGVFKVAYQSEPVEVPGGDMPEWRPQLLAAVDINKDGKGEVVYVENVCGAHTCSLTVRILTGTASGYVSLAGDEVTMATATVALEDKDGDGRLEVVLHGGEIGSVGAGPQRTRTDVYAWDGAAYTLSQTVFDPTDILYLRVTEADALFATGTYDEALAVYEQALNDPSLKTWKEQVDMVAPERTELYAYILFRMGLTSFATGDDAQGLAYVQQTVDEYAGNLHGDLAGAFLSSYQADGNLSVACAAVDAFVADNLNLLTAFWEYGYANPTFNPDAVCPF